MKCTHSRSFDGSVPAVDAGAEATEDPAGREPMPRPTRLVSEPLQTERQPNGRRLLLRKLEVDVDGEVIPIPKHTVTDYSSIPWFGRIVVRWSKVDIAGVVHDHLYCTQTMSRARADRIWRLVAVAGEHHANALQAWICWAALRLGGWIAWNQHRQGGCERAS